MNETAKKIEELKEQIDELEKEVAELEKVNTNYYVLELKRSCSDQWGYYEMETTYMLLGYITEAEAKQHAIDYHENSWYDDAEYFEVTEEEYKLYKCWLDLESVLKSGSEIDSDIFDNKEDFDNLLRKQISNIHLKLLIDGGCYVDSLIQF